MFGSGSQTLVGPGQITQGKVYEQMAEYMNIITGNLNLTEPQMHQRLNTFKGKYFWAKEFEWNTGAGIEEKEGYNSLKQKLEDICPCFDRMDCLFKENSNITPMSFFDSSSSDPMNSIVLSQEDGMVNPIPLSQEPDETQESMLSQWEATPWAIHTYHSSTGENSDQHNPMDLEGLEENPPNTEEHTGPDQDVQPRNLVNNHDDLQNSSQGSRPGNSQQSRNSSLNRLESQLSPTASFLVSGGSQNVIPNMHWVASQSSHTSSALRQKQLTLATHRHAGTKSSGLTSAFESSTTQKMLVMEKHLELETRRLMLKLEDSQVACHDCTLERNAQQIQQDLDREARQLEHEAKLHQKEQDQQDHIRELDLQRCKKQPEQEERKEERGTKEMERKERREMVTKWLDEGKTPAEIQILSQIIFGL